MMEKRRPYVVQMAEQCEQTFLLLVIPNLYFIIITSGHKQRLVGVEIDASNWTF
jgi:hypothetical protein